jgi:hypothetical protein
LSKLGDFDSAARHLHHLSQQQPKNPEIGICWAKSI